MYRVELDPGDAGAEFLAAHYNTDTRTPHFSICGAYSTSISARETPNVTSLVG